MDKAERLQDDWEIALVGHRAAGAHAVGGTPQEMAAFVKREFARWSKLIKSVGIRLD